MQHEKKFQACILSGDASWNSAACWGSKSEMIMRYVHQAQAFELSKATDSMVRAVISFKPVRDIMSPCYRAIL